VSSSSGQLDTFGGPLIVEAGAGTNHLTISEAGRVAPDHVVVQSTVISSPVVGFGIIYQATGGTFGGGVDFDAGQGNDIVEVVSQLSKSPLTIFGDGGDDTFNVAVTPSSSYSQFTLDGGPGTDTLNVVDQTNTAVMQQFPSGPGAGSIRVAYLGGSVSALSYRNMEGVKNSVDPNSSYIQALYHVELAANAGPGDFAFWSDVLQAEGRQAVAQGIHDSGAARTHRVLGWYSQYLNFVPKDGGEQFWVNLLASQSEEAVLSAFLGSQAYFDKSGDNGEGFIRTIYKDLLNRDPGTNELQLWLQTLLPRSGRPGVALLILTSPEYRTNTINAFYTNLLHHSASDAALNFWVNNALSLSQIQVMIEASDEFFAVGG